MSVETLWHSQVQKVNTRKGVACRWALKLVQEKGFELLATRKGGTCRWALKPLIRGYFFTFTRKGDACLWALNLAELAKCDDSDLTGSL